MNSNNTNTNDPNDDFLEPKRRPAAARNALSTSVSSGNRCSSSRIRPRSSSSTAVVTSSLLAANQQQQPPPNHHHHHQQQQQQPPPPPPPTVCMISHEVLLQQTEMIRRHSQMILDLVGDDDAAGHPSIQQDDHDQAAAAAKQPARDFKSRRENGQGHGTKEVTTAAKMMNDWGINKARVADKTRTCREQSKLQRIRIHEELDEEEEQDDDDDDTPSPFSDELQRQNTELIRRHSQMILDLVGDVYPSPTPMMRQGAENEHYHHQQEQQHEVVVTNYDSQHSYNNNGIVHEEKRIAAKAAYKRKASFRQKGKQAEHVPGGRRLTTATTRYTTTTGYDKTQSAAAADNDSELLLKHHTEDLIQQHSQMILNLVSTVGPVNDNSSCRKEETILVTKHHPSLAISSRQEHAIQRSSSSSLLGITLSRERDDESKQQNPWTSSRRKQQRQHEQQLFAQTGAGGASQFQEEEQVVWGLGTTTAATACNIINRTNHQHCTELIRRHSQIILDLIMAKGEPELVQEAIMAASLVLEETNTKSTAGGGGNNDNSNDEHSVNNLRPFRELNEEQQYQNHHYHHQHPGDIENGIIKIALSLGDDDDGSTIVAACCRSPIPLYLYAHHALDSSSRVVVLVDIPQLVDPHEEEKREKKVMDEIKRKIPHATPVAQPAGSGVGHDAKHDNHCRGVLSILLPHFFSILFLLAVVVVSGIVVFNRRGAAATGDYDSQNRAPPPRHDEHPSVRPSANSGGTTISSSLSPTPVIHAPRLPTVESVIQHGKLRCGVQDFELAYHPDPETCGVQDDPRTCGKKSMEIDLCRAVAAAIFGNAQQYELVEMQIDERFIALHNETVDLYLRAAPTMERDIYEKTTRAGFSFSVPYGYGTVRFGGHSRFVDCADQRDTVGECSDLQVCVIKGSLHTEMLGLPQSYLVERELDGMLSGLLHGPCNVAIGHTADLEKALPLVPIDIDVKLGSRVLASEPVAIVTRDDDPMWSDLVNWVLLALVHADDLGITQSKAHHFPTTMSFGKGFEHMFQHAIGSVGTFLEIRNRYSIGLDDKQKPRDALHLVSSDRELSGALLSPDLGNAHGTVGPDPVATGYMNRIIQRGYVNCGITRQLAGFARQDAQSGEWSGMDVDFCRAVSASLFHGKPDDDHLKIVDFDDNNNINDTLQEEAFEALTSGRVDLLSGMSMSLSRDVSEPSSGKGFSFSLPYYYDNEQLGTTRALVSRQDDSQWSSFVYWTVAGTIYAEERQITQFKNNSNDMPVVKLFGNNFTHMLRDAILHVGNYGEIYRRNLQVYIPRHGLNLLSSDQIGQQLGRIAFY